MPKIVEHVDPLPDFERFYNRTRFIDETSHGLSMLLKKSKRNKSWLAKRLGQSGRSAMTKALRGDNNFKLETLADISLALGRAVHVVWGTDLQEMRFPMDEADLVTNSASAGEIQNVQQVQDEQSHDHHLEVLASISDGVVIKTRGTEREGTVSIQHQPDNPHRVRGFIASVG